MKGISFSLLQRRACFLPFSARERRSPTVGSRFRTSPPPSRSRYILSPSGEISSKPSPPFVPSTSSFPSKKKKHSAFFLPPVPGIVPCASVPVFPPSHTEELPRISFFPPRHDSLDTLPPPGSNGFGSSSLPIPFHLFPLLLLRVLSLLPTTRKPLLGPPFFSCRTGCSHRGLYRKLFGLSPFCGGLIGCVLSFPIDDSFSLSAPFRMLFVFFPSLGSPSKESVPALFPVFLLRNWVEAAGRGDSTEDIGTIVRVWWSFSLLLAGELFPS